MSQYSAKGAEWEATRERVLKRDNYTCVYDGAEATEVDHVIARANGGTDTDDNLVAACRKCNATKGKKLMARMEWYDSRWLPNGIA